MRKRKIFFYSCLVLGLCCGLYACLIEPQRLVTRKWSVATDKWGDQPSLRVALISDTHAIWPWMTQAHLERIVDYTNALQPDLILLLGDYVATHPFGLQLKPEDGVAPFAKLKAPCGVFAVMGNHDFERQGWVSALSQVVPVLQNDARRVGCGKRAFWIAGLQELWKQHPNINKTLAHVTDGSPVIVMTHNPDSFVNVPPSVALTVAGHMHAGQIRIPFIGAVTAVLPSKYGQRFVYGRIKENGNFLVVSGGLGMTGIPARFLAPPEVTFVSLNKDYHFKEISKDIAIP